MQNTLQRVMEPPPVETKFLCMSTEQRIGSTLDGWKVAWCEPDQKRILWHVMLLRRVQFRGLLQIDGCRARAHDPTRRLRPLVRLIAKVYQMVVNGSEIKAFL